MSGVWVEKPLVEACPEDCAFDWADFHYKLDVALGHFIEEMGGRPSQTSVIEFAAYSKAKREASRLGDNE